MEDHSKKFSASDDKLAKKRLQVIQLAETMGNVSKACRQSGMDRTSFYEWRRRYKAYGFDGLKDMLPVHKNHPQTTSTKSVKKILEIAYAHPEWGCIRISDQLKKTGTYVSSPTVQKILIKNNLSSISERAIFLEEKSFKEKWKLSSSQIKSIERVNPAFKERSSESKNPGQSVIIDIIPINPSKGKTSGYVYAAIDTYGSFVIAQLFPDSQFSNLEEFLRKTVLAQYNAWKLKIQTICTDRSREFLSSEFQSLLADSPIKHSLLDGLRANRNGFLLKFRNYLMRDWDYTDGKKTVPQFPLLKKSFTNWLNTYNTQEHPGFPNMGESPAQIWKKKGIKV